MLNRLKINQIYISTIEIIAYLCNVLSKGLNAMKPAAMSNGCENVEAEDKMLKI